MQILPTYLWIHKVFFARMWHQELEAKKNAPADSHTEPVSWQRLKKKKERSRKTLKSTWLTAVLPSSSLVGKQVTQNNTNCAQNTGDTTIFQSDTMSEVPYFAIVPT